MKTCRVCSCNTWKHFLSLPQVQRATHMIWGYLGMKREDWTETYLVPSNYSREEKECNTTENLLCGRLVCMIKICSSSKT